VTASPAARLLAAADLLDKRANEATDGPWAACEPNDLWKRPYVIETRTEGLVSKWKAEGDDEIYPHSFVIAETRQGGPRMADAEWIALVNPEIGKALADLLRAEVSEMYDPSAQAVALADALLAGDPNEQ
jgi:hypothetical protein